MLFFYGTVPKLIDPVNSFYCYHVDGLPCCNDLNITVLPFFQKNYLFNFSLRFNSKDEKILYQAHTFFWETMQLLNMSVWNFVILQVSKTHTHTNTRTLWKVMTKKYDGIWWYLRVWLNGSWFVIHNKRIWISTTKFFVVMNFFGLR